MRLPRLAIFAVLALATAGAPLAGTAIPDSHDTDDIVQQITASSTTLATNNNPIALEERGRGRKPAKATNTTPSKKTPPSNVPIPSTDGRKTLKTLRDAFKMNTKFVPAGPKATGTRTVPAKGMVKVPKTLEIAKGSFVPSDIINKRRFQISEADYRDVLTVIESTRLTSYMNIGSYSGELGLSHVLYQQVGGPINLVLKAIKQGGLWKPKAKGGAPIEDWRYVKGTNTRAVLELKTSQALPKDMVQNIMTLVEERMLEMVDRDDENGQPLHSLDVDGSEALLREDRDAEVRALEQVSHTKIINYR